MEAWRNQKSRGSLRPFLWGFEENETEEPEIESDWIWQILKFENLKELKFEVLEIWGFGENETEEPEIESDRS